MADMERQRGKCSERESKWVMERGRERWTGREGERWKERWQRE